MRRIFCDCCKREILDTEQLFNMKIEKGQDAEIIIDDMCVDCYEEIKYAINHIKQW